MATSPSGDNSYTLSKVLESLSQDKTPALLKVFTSTNENTLNAEPPKKLQLVLQIVQLRTSKGDLKPTSIIRGLKGAIRAMKEVTFK